MTLKVYIVALQEGPFFKELVSWLVG